MVKRFSEEELNSVSFQHLTPHDGFSGTNYISGILRTKCQCCQQHLPPTWRYEITNIGLTIFFKCQISVINMVKGDHIEQPCSYCYLDKSILVPASICSFCLLYLSSPVHERCQELPCLLLFFLLTQQAAQIVHGLVDASQHHGCSHSTPTLWNEWWAVTGIRWHFIISSTYSEHPNFFLPKSDIPN